MIVETVAVGTELLLGQIVNTNATRIGERLADAGFDHFHQSVVGDNLERMVGVIRHAVGRSDAVIITGGIGPTQDDVTREALCLAAGVEMRYSDDYEEQLRRRWERRGRVMPESNLRQAEYPDGAAMIPNPRGSAPGLRLRIGDAWVFAVPGVPAEMLPMLDDEIIPFLQRESGEGPAVVVSRLIRSWGLSESGVGEVLGDLFDRSRNPTMAFLASSGEIKVRLTAKASSEAEARALIAPVEQEVRSRLGAHVFGADHETIEWRILDLLERRGWTIATAESATGGLIAGRLTSVAGASAGFRGGVIAYQEDVKEQLLEVPANVIAGEGVVSEATACAMAEGAARRLGADVVIAVTGSAGPDPQERPVGTMIVAVRTPEDLRARTLTLPGDRERVRTFTTTAALHLARLAIEGSWWSSDGGSLWGVRPGERT